MNQIFLNGITLLQLADALRPLLNLPRVEQLKILNELLTRDQACALLTINKTTLWKHTKSGRLKSYGLGNRVYYKREELLAAIKPINF